MFEEGDDTISLVVVPCSLDHRSSHAETDFGRKCWGGGWTRHDEDCYIDTYMYMSYAVGRAFMHPREKKKSQYIRPWNSCQRESRIGLELNDRRTAPAQPTTTTSTYIIIAVLGTLVSSDA